MNKIYTKVFTCTAVLSITAIAFASDWSAVIKPVALNKDEPYCLMTPSLDVQSAKRDGDQVHAWTRIAFGPTKLQCKLEVWKQIDTFNEYNCKTKTRQTIDYNLMTWDGKITQGNIHPPTMNVDPQTLDEVLWSATCNNIQ